MFGKLLGRAPSSSGTDDEKKEEEYGNECSSGNFKTERQCRRQSVYEEAMEMLTASLIIYIFAEIRAIAKEGTANDDGDAPDLNIDDLQCPLTGERVLRVIRASAGALLRVARHLGELHNQRRAFARNCGAEVHASTAKGLVALHPHVAQREALVDQAGPLLDRRPGLGAAVSPLRAARVAAEVRALGALGRVPLAALCLTPDIHHVGAAAGARTSAQRRQTAVLGAVLTDQGDVSCSTAWV